GRTQPMVSKEGVSPLKIEAQIDEATAAFSRGFEVWVVHREGEEAVGEVRLGLPHDGRKPIAEQPTEIPVEKEATKAPVETGKLESSEENAKPKEQILNQSFKV